jgi:hypothetical protein
MRKRAEERNQWWQNLQSEDRQRKRKFTQLEAPFSASYGFGRQRPKSSRRLMGESLSSDDGALQKPNPQPIAKPKPKPSAKSKIEVKDVTKPTSGMCLTNLTFLSRS